jgi:hypothetical protein
LTQGEKGAEKVPEIHQGDGSRIAGLRSKSNHLEKVREDFDKRSAEAAAERERKALMHRSKPVAVEEPQIEPGAIYVAKSAFSALINNTSMFFEQGEVIPPDRPDIIKYLLHEKFDIGIADKAALDRWNRKSVEADEEVLQVLNLYGSRSPLYHEIVAQKLAERQQLQTQ